MSIYTLLIIQATILIFVFIFLYNLYRKIKIQKENQNKLIEKYKKTNWNRININSPNFHEKILKNKGYEFGGILIDNDFDFKIIYINDLNQEVIHNFYKDTTKIKESNSFKTSNLHWISIQDKNDNLFIVADTGINAQDSKEKTADLINKIYSNVNDFKGLNSNEFSLEKNKASIIVMFLIFGLIFCAIFVRI